MARAMTYATSGSKLSLRARAAQTDSRFRKGLTLIEMLVVVAVIIILAGAVVSLTRHIDNQAKVKALNNTFVLLKSALREYYEVMDAFPVQTEPDQSPARVTVHAEYLYLQLASVPQSREMLRRIDSSLVLGRADANDVRISDPWGAVIDYRYTPVYKDKDGKDKEGDTFPTLISAGPDKMFGTLDDIDSRKL